MSLVHARGTEYMVYQKYVSTPPKYIIWSVCYLIAVPVLPFSQHTPSCVHFPTITRRKNYVTDKRIKEEELTGAVQNLLRVKCQSSFTSLSSLLSRH